SFSSLCSTISVSPRSKQTAQTRRPARSASSLASCASTRPGICPSSSAQLSQGASPASQRRSKRKVGAKWRGPREPRARTARRGAGWGGERGGADRPRDQPATAGQPVGRGGELAAQRVELAEDARVGRHGVLARLGVGDRSIALAREAAGLDERAVLAVPARL